MGEMFDRIEAAAASVRERTDICPEIGIILGSGLGSFAEKINIESTVEYGEISGFPVSTVTGHKGRFVFGYCGGVPVVLMQGRVHYYEGYDMTDVVMPTRVMGALGIKNLILTNAAGGIDRSMSPGDLMLITGQISSFVPSPLRGENDDRLGVRFPDMSGLYEKGLCDCIRNAAKENGIELKEGTYIQLPGPNFESVAEIKMCEALGASAVGMSTACEAVAARHMGIGVCGVSLISNLASGISPMPQTSDEVNENAEKAADKFSALIHDSVINIHKIK